MEAHEATDFIYWEYMSHTAENDWLFIAGENF